MSAHTWRRTAAAPDKAHMIVAGRSLCGVVANGASNGAAPERASAKVPAETREFGDALDDLPEEGDDEEPLSSDEFEDEDDGDTDGDGDDEDDALAGADGHTPSGSPNGTRYLKCVLTKDEIDDLRAALEAEDETMEELALELAATKDKAKTLQKRIDVLIADGRAKSRTIRTGYEHRDVPCEERQEADTREGSSTFGKLIAVTYRCDTWEAIDWRELTGRERQGSLFTGAPDTTETSSAAAL